MRSLTTLYLAGNKITRIAPGDFAGAARLVVLTLGGNRIVSVAAQAFGNLDAFRVRPDDFSPTAGGVAYRDAYGVGTPPPSLSHTHTHTHTHTNTLVRFLARSHPSSIARRLDGVPSAVPCAMPCRSFLGLWAHIGVGFFGGNQEWSQSPISLAPNPVCSRE